MTAGAGGALTAVGQNIPVSSLAAGAAGFVLGAIAVTAASKYVTSRRDKARKTA